jgi:hypothetical protein
VVTRLLTVVAATAAFAASGALTATAAVARDDVALGAPAQLRTARLADLDARPGAREEAWVIRLFDPKTHRRLTFNAERRSEYLVKALLETPGQPYVDTAIAWDGRSGNGRVWGDGDDSLALVRNGRSGMTLTGRGSEVEGQVVLSGLRPGAYASRWRFGTDFRGVTRELTWSEPVATATASGHLALRDWDQHADVDIRGWRVSIEHWWGYLSAQDGFASFVLHQPRGRAWTLVGAPRPDLIFGPGAIDALWLAVLVRTDRHGVRLCRPRIHRLIAGVLVQGRPQPGATRARCAHRPVTFAETRGEDSGATADVGLHGTGGGLGSSHFVPGGR